MGEDGAAIAYLPIVAAVVGYVLGSVPFGMVLTRLGGYGDIRDIGSGNIGATNVLRTGNKALAAITLALDAAKGALAVLVFAPWGAEVAVVAGLAAVVGHNFPLWLNFKGGKGVATSLGVLAAAHWPVGLIAGLAWLAVAMVSRYSSLAALVGLGAAPFAALWLDQQATSAMAGALAALAFFRHATNIRRLLSGTEPKIGQKAEDATESAKGETT